MTLIVGIRCEEGVVIAADTRATMGALGQPTTSQDVTKLDIPHEGVILGVTGPVGLGQKIRMCLADSWAELKGSKFDLLKARNRIREKMWEQVEPEINHAAIAARLIGQQIAAQSAVCSALIALPIRGEPTLLTFDQQCASEEVTAELPFVSMGAGQAWADPFLAFLKESFWENHAPKRVSDGTLAAIWTVDHVIQRYPSGNVGGGVTVARLFRSGDKNTAEMLPTEVVEEHREHYKGAIRQLAEYLGPMKAAA